MTVVVLIEISSNGDRLKDISLCVPSCKIMAGNPHKSPPGSSPGVLSRGFDESLTSLTPIGFATDRTAWHSTREHSPLSLVDATLTMPATPPAGTNSHACDLGIAPKCTVDRELEPTIRPFSTSPDIFPSGVAHGPARPLRCAFGLSPVAHRAISAHFEHSRCDGSQVQRPFCGGQSNCPGIAPSTDQPLHREDSQVDFCLFGTPSPAYKEMNGVRWPGQGTRPQSSV